MKNIFKLCLCAILLSVAASVVYADGMVFEPVEMPSNSAPSSIPAQNAQPEKTSFFSKFKSEDKVADMSLKENQKMQSALTDLDASQIELRQNLQEATQKYTTTDSNYVKVKAERSALKKEVKSLEKKLKNLDKVKKSIRKNML